MWKLKGQEGVLDDVHVTVDLRQEWASHRPFGQPDRRSSFQPDRVAIETSNGDVVERIATHSAEQTFYFDRQGLLKRHDYRVDVAGGTAAAHYVSALTDVSGIVVPTTHTIFPRQRDGSSAPTPVVVSIDISDIEFG